MNFASTSDSRHFRSMKMLWVAVGDVSEFENELANMLCDHGEPIEFTRALYGQTIAVARACVWFERCHFTQVSLDPELSPDQIDATMADILSEIRCLGLEWISLFVDVTDREGLRWIRHAGFIPAKLPDGSTGEPGSEYMLARTDKCLERLVRAKPDGTGANGLAIPTVLVQNTAAFVSSRMQPDNVFSGEPPTQREAACPLNHSQTLVRH